MIEAESLRKQFGTVAAVQHVSFTSPNGAITGLLGANGAGKTTTLRMIAGVLRPNAGQVLIDGLPATETGAQHRIGALLDHTGLYPRLSMRENLEYFARLRGLPEPEERVSQIVSLLGLQAIADRRAAGFSHGERMKTALGRAIIHSPGNLLLDEPTNGLDVPTVRALRALLKEMRDRGVCVIFSSHVLEEVRGLCDHVVVIAKGSVVAQGSPGQICDLTETQNLEDAFVRLTTGELQPC